MVDYLKAQKIIHWLMAFVIMLDLNVAQKFGGDMELWDRLESRADHATAGLIVTFLFFLRLYFRYRYGAPALPESMPKWQVISAKAGHYCLYILMGMLIVTGILSANYTADPIIVFGTLNLSSEVENIQIFNLIRGIHEFATNAIIALITIHILAALYHQFIAKDDTTLNMTKFWTSKLNNE
jgi:cytochrome b561